MTFSNDGKLPRKLGVGTLHASSWAPAARSMTSSLHVINDVIPISTVITHMMLRQLRSYLFLLHLVTVISMTSSRHPVIASSSTSSYIFSYRVIVIFYNATSSYHVMSNVIKRQHRTHSVIHRGQQQRQFTGMDELKNLQLIEELCRNLRRQQQQPQQHQSLPSTG